MSIESTAHKVTMLQANRKHWGPIIAEFQQKIADEQQRLREMKIQRGETMLIAENGDIQAIAEIEQLATRITTSQERIESLTAGLAAAQDSEAIATARSAEEEKEKRLNKVKRLHKELLDACADIDKSLVTLASRHEKLTQVQSELLEACGRGDIQLIEYIQSPRRNIPRCLASHLPMHSGFEKLDEKPRLTKPLVPSLEVVISLLKWNR